MVDAGSMSRTAARRCRQAARVGRGLREARGAIRSAAAGPVTCTPASYHALIRLLATGCDSLLDVGTGDMRSLEFSPCRNRVGVEAHRPYLDNRAVRGPVPINADAKELGRLFVNDAVDLVTMLDVIEHLDPEDASSVLDQIEAIAAKRVVIATPRGFFKQDAHDIFEMGLGGEELQAHRSGWEVEDFARRGYRVAIFAGLHGAENSSFARNYGEDAQPIDGLVAWKELA